MTENVIYPRSITTIPNQAMFYGKSITIQFFYPTEFTTDPFNEFSGHTIQ